MSQKPLIDIPPKPFRRDRKLEKQLGQTVENFQRARRAMAPRLGWDPYTKH